MGIRFFKAYTSGTRSRRISNFVEITKLKPEKNLSKFFHNPKGRNNRGVLNMFLKFYLIDFSVMLCLYNF
jgi:large subunit ribosomal protein L2